MMASSMITPTITPPPLLEQKTTTTTVTTKTVSNDPSLLYYTYILMNKLNCNLRYYNYLENIWEADEIVDGIFLGALSSSYNKEELRKREITHVVSVLAGYEPPFPGEFNYMVINALDNQSSNLIEVFDEVNMFITDAIMNNENVLIHCAYGRSRSATITAAYLIKTFGMNLERVLSVLKSKREIVEPNSNYVKQLGDYYKMKFGDEKQKKN